MLLEQILGRLIWQNSFSLNDKLGKVLYFHTTRLFTKEYFFQGHSMTLYHSLTIVHVSCALISIGGFILRGYWMLNGSSLLNHRLAKIVPHIVDTLLLGSAVAMLAIWQTSPLAHSWLTAKIVALILYIGLGMIALRFGKTRRVRATAWLCALLVAAYIVSVALTKSASGFFAWV